MKRKGQMSLLLKDCRILDPSREIDHTGYLLIENAQKIIKFFRI